MRYLGDITIIRSFSMFEKMAGKLILHVISPVYEQMVSKCKKITRIVCLSCFVYITYMLKHISATSAIF